MSITEIKCPECGTSNEILFTSKRDHGLFCRSCGRLISGAPKPLLNHIEIYKTLSTKIAHNLLIAYSQGFFKNRTRSLIFLILLRNKKVTGLELQEDYAIPEATVYYTFQSMTKEGLIKIGPRINDSLRRGPKPHYYLFADETKFEGGWNDL